LWQLLLSFLKNWKLRKSLTNVIFSILTLIWQLFALFACCLGVGFYLRFLLPSDFSPLNKAYFCLIGGLFLVVLTSQNFVYLGVPVRISAWILFAAALVQGWFCRRNFVARVRTICSDAEIRATVVVILLTISFHGIVPSEQGLDSYYGKGHFDQTNYVLLAEFLKEEPYGTGEHQIGLRPWLVGPVGSDDTTEPLGAASRGGLETIGLKNERIGQSIVTAETSVWSGTNSKGGYAATVIFFLTVLAICLYAFLREGGINRFMAGSGAVLAACLPVITRLSLDGFLSQTGILFVFPFFASLLRHENLRARSFVVFFSLTVAYLVAVYSEIAPLGFCTLILGVMVVRRDSLRSKRLMLMSAILLIAIANPYYLYNLIRFLAYQYNLAASAPSVWDNLVPNVLTLAGWSEIIFGATANPRFAVFFDCCVLLLSGLFVAGILTLARRDKLIFSTILLPVVAIIVYLTTRTPYPYYPIAKMTLTVVPFLIGLVFAPLSGISARQSHRPVRVLMSLLSASIVAATATGSVRYYSAVLNNEGLLTIFRGSKFLDVCRGLETIKNRRVFIFETHPLLAAWLCYHARHNEVYFDGQWISDSTIPAHLAFSIVPDLADVDLVATRDQITNLRLPGVSCLTSVDDILGEDWKDGHLHYLLGPPARLRFLAPKPISASLKMRLATTPAATVLPLDFFVTDAQGHVSQSELWGKNVEVLGMNLPRGLSYLEVSVKAKGHELNTGPSYPILAELEGIEISVIDAKPGG
jgi:hypothetical protein